MESKVVQINSKGLILDVKEKSRCVPGFFFVFISSQEPKSFFVRLVQRG